MPTYAENLATTQANYAATLAEISADPKLTYRVGDREFSWTEYQTFLLDALDKVEKQLQHATGPFIVRRRGRR
jgi:hypothetical protein